MPELFDTSTIRDNPEHWDAFAARVATRASRTHASINWLAEPRARWTAAALLVAASMMFALLPRRSTTANPDTAWATALAPTDLVGRAVVTRDQPPTIGMLLLTSAASGDGR